MNVSLLEINFCGFRVVTMHYNNVQVFNFAETVHLQNESRMEFKAFTAC